MQYVVVKAGQLYTGGPSYNGPSCRRAGVKGGQIYDSMFVAQNDAIKLSIVNPNGYFMIDIYRP